MGQINLAIVILEQIGHGTLQDSWLSAGKPSGMFSTCDTQATGFDTNHLDLLVPDECIEESYRIAATADASDEAIRQPALCRQNLSPSFPSDNRLEVTNHHRIRMGTKYRTENIMGRTDIRRPVPHGFADGILKSSASCVDSCDGRAKESHPEDIQRLALHV